VGRGVLGQGRVEHGEGARDVPQVAQGDGPPAGLPRRGGRVTRAVAGSQPLRVRVGRPVRRGVGGRRPPARGDGRAAAPDPEGPDRADGRQGRDHDPPRHGRGGAAADAPDEQAGGPRRQVVVEGVGARVAVRRVLLEAAEADPLEARVDPRPLPRRRLGRARDGRPEHGVDRVGPDRGPPGEEGVEGRPDPVDVGRRAQGLELTGGLLRRPEARRPDEGPGAGQGAPLEVEVPGEAEVGQEDAPVPGEEDVARLHVAVEDAGRVGGREGPGRVPGHARRLAHAEGPAPEPLGQALALDEVHDEVAAAALDAGVAQRHDPRVVEPAVGGDLPLEAAPDDLGQRPTVVEDLDGDRSAVGGAPPIDGPGGAPAQLPLDPVAAERAHDPSVAREEASS